MYPTIYHMVRDVLGLEIELLRFVNSFGFFVVLGFLAAAVTLGMEIHRKTISGVFPVQTKTVTKGGRPDLFSAGLNVLIAFAFGFKVLGVIFHSPDLSEPTAYLLSSQGSLFGGLLFAAISIALTYRAYAKERATYPTPTDIQVPVSAADHASSLAMRAAIWGFIGAKFFALVENPQDLIDFFVDFNVKKVMSGLAIYGGLIFGALAVMHYFKKNGMNVLAGADSAAPGVMIAYGIGRLGCHFSGDGDWGVVNTLPKPSFLPDWLWSYTYPNNVNGVLGPNDKGGYVAKRISEDMGIEAYEGYGTYLDPGVWPTSVYEFLMAAVLFCILWSLRKRLSPKYGLILFVYVIFVGVERFFIEGYRVNTDHDFMGLSMTQAEYISIVLILIGVAGVIWRMSANMSEQQES